MGRRILIVAGLTAAALVISAILLPPDGGKPMPSTGAQTVPVESSR